MAKYLQCSECGKLAFYYDDFVGTEKPSISASCATPKANQARAAPLLQLRRRPAPDPRKHQRRKSGREALR